MRFYKLFLTAGSLAICATAPAEDASSPLAENAVALEELLPEEVRLDSSGEQEELSIELIDEPLQEMAPLLTTEKAAEEEQPQAMPAQIVQQAEQPLKKEQSIPPDLKEEESPAIQISLQQVFAGSPVIYSLLLCLSTSAVCIWLYTLLSLRRSGVMPQEVVKTLRNKLYSNHYEEALSICEQKDSFFCKMLASGITTRRYGLVTMVEAMKTEGKRATANLWQRTALLNDIAIIAPMIGLLGTVLGMFYAFYDINRSMESVTTLFDGLGISVGTTVAGLIVAILAMILQSMTKYRLVKLLTDVENEAQSFAVAIDSHSSSFKGEKA